MSHTRKKEDVIGRLSARDEPSYIMRAVDRGGTVHPEESRNI